MIEFLKGVGVFLRCIGVCVACFLGLAIPWGVYIALHMLLGDWSKFFWDWIAPITLPAGMLFLLAFIGRRIEYLTIFRTPGEKLFERYDDYYTW